MPQPPAKVGGGGPPALTDVLTSAAGYAAEEKAAGTRRAYRSDWRHFEAWASEVKIDFLPASPPAVAAYLAHLADIGLKASTISRRLAAIAYAHKLKGLDSPTTAEGVRQVLRGIRRSIGTAQVQKAPATDQAISAMLGAVPEGLAGIRDKALLLLGFAAALRRSEIVALHFPDLELHQDGLLLHIRRSKTDQEGQGAAIAVPRGGRLKPVEAVEAWFAASKIDAGPCFRPIDRHGRIGADALTDRSVADIVKRHAAAAGLDPKLFSGHSLRAGFVTSALEHGADLFKVMDVTRHKRLETLKGYDRRAQAFKNHAGKDFL
jgi:site-specific recombinase XerD